MDMRDNQRLEITVGIIGFLQREKGKREREGTFLWQASVKKHFLLSAQKRALSSGRLKTRRALATSHNNNNSRKDSAPELNLKFKQNGDGHIAVKRKMFVISVPRWICTVPYILFARFYRIHE